MCIYLYYKRNCIPLKTQSGTTIGDETNKCETHVSEVDLQFTIEVLPNEALLAFRFLKENMNTKMIADDE